MGAERKDMAAAIMGYVKVILEMTSAVMTAKMTATLQEEEKDERNKGRPLLR